MKTATSIWAMATMALASPALAMPTDKEKQREYENPTADDAVNFVADTEYEMFNHSIDAGRIYWINSTYITDDTDALAAKVGAEGTVMSVEAAMDAAQFNDVPGIDPVTKRKLDKLRGGIVLPAPAVPGAATVLNEIATKLNSAYGKGKGTLKGEPINGSDIEAAMGTNRNPDELSEMWESWHSQVGTPMKDDYARMVEIANEGAQDLGFADVGAMWRSGYDMPADDFAKLTDKLWSQVKPLYDELHCYTRDKLNEEYGDKVQSETGPIRADLLGNMWAQEWGNIYDIVAPEGAGDIGFDTTELLTSKGYDAIKMVKAGEGFFSSLGFAPLPETFWQRSQFIKPADREVVCHA
ncbi:MAG: M2 family metallopeptidase, partial [Parasphingorhabdus sp.]